jgi:hypothetical protein
MRSLIVQTAENEEFRITIPTNACATFGPAVPYVPKAGYTPTHNGYSLRIYKTKSKDSLMAVFTGIISFRDIAIPMEVRQEVDTKKGKSEVF